VLGYPSIAMHQQPSGRLAPTMLGFVAAAVLFLSGVVGAAAQATPDQAAPTAIQPGDADCGTDMSCFADKAATCTPSTVAYTITLDFAPLVGLQSGFPSSTTDALRLQPDPAGSGACQFSLRIQQVDNRLLPEAVQTLKDRGTMQADIDATVLNMSNSGKAIEGRSGTCLFAPDDLSTMLESWVAGNFSSDDFAAGNCQGSYFNN
jgi:hypothetical protein